MAEGSVCRPIENQDLDIRVRKIASEWLSASSHNHFTITGTQIAYSNVQGYSYEIIFEIPEGEGMLEIKFNATDEFTVKEI